MKLEPPFANLVARCQAICEAECCGIDAFDFSPIQIASYLTMYRGHPDASEIAVLRDQIQVLRAEHGLSAARESGTVVDDLNQMLTAERIEALADELLANLEVALRIIKQSESMRYAAPRPPAPMAGGPATPVGTAEAAGGCPPPHEDLQSAAR